ncbi:hypothetical protein BJ165DRAFT_1510005 [Panaeolus papilionaceus]|nr:hypothetical protein BJ165DRAFT_1510005 [Panaeolus papilionaceus]
MFKHHRVLTLTLANCNKYVITLIYHLFYITLCSRALVARIDIRSFETGLDLNHLHHHHNRGVNSSHLALGLEALTFIVLLPSILNIIGTLATTNNVPFIPFYRTTMLSFTSFIGLLR